MKHTAPIKLALVDDHKLFRKGLIGILEMMDKEYEIIFEAENGIDLQQKIQKDNQPDIILMDVNMPGMDGFDAVKWLVETYPLVNILVISMVEKEEQIVKMLKLGVKGYLYKDIEPNELKNALNSIVNKGYYYTDFITGKLIHSIQHPSELNETQDAFHLLNEREMEFLKFACTEMTYNEIAHKMFLSPKTIDGYRNALFEKLNVKSRVGLAMYAVKNGLVEISN
ncbi:response regulator transcription factor [Danxiaibacter flavus]|uniref:Response regulator transcription factor n=1 Tax=Danxiaibacter flavus TaxID=3049108 RepID=A0ABV3ZKM4_9BACT|nr:response regulator transcription factor [Chitinophagaceae bacterium DXS]